MKKVARYSFDAHLESELAVEQVWSDASERVESWLQSKGSRRAGQGSSLIAYADGRTATLTESRIQGGGGTLHRWILEEPTREATRFKTALSLARSNLTVSVACDLEWGTSTTVLAPISVDVRCPQLIRELLASKAPWVVGQTPVPAEPIHLPGTEGGKALVEMILDGRRSVPLVVVSEFEGFPLHPELAKSLAHDLAGLAVTVSLNDEASWMVTKTLGSGLSCYHGAVRIYWPRCTRESSPFAHPLWTAQRLMFNAGSTEGAARRIRAVIRERLLTLSTSTVHPADLIEQVERAHRAQQQEEAKKLQDWAGLEKLLEDENARLALENAQLQEEIERLRIDVGNLRVQLDFASREGEALEALEAVRDIPPATVQEAYERAQANFPNLLFGDDVPRGVEGLAPDAGPPEKVLDYLGALSRLAVALADGPLGRTPIQWLNAENFHASGESETVSNSRVEAQRRTWHDGDGRSLFELHQQVNEGTSPDRCVRIYFKWMGTRRRMVVGWLGRHP